MKGAPCKKNPIIIIGAARSGTKFLRDLLRASNSVCVMPYDVNYIWKYGNEKVFDDELSVSSITKKKEVYIKRMLCKLSGANKNDSTIFVEKTVSNTLRVPYVEAVFPGAKYVHLVRDGRAVTESALRMWTDPPEAGYLAKKIKFFPWSNYRYAISYGVNLLKGKLAASRGQKIWGPKYRQIDEDLESMSLIEVCARQWAKCVSKATESLNQIPKNRVLTIRYEDFLSSCDSLEELCEYIGIPDKENVLQAYSQRLQKTNLNKWQNILTEDDMRKIDKYISPMLKTYKYI